MFDGISHRLGGGTNNAGDALAPVVAAVRAARQRVGHLLD